MSKHSHEHIETQAEAAVKAALKAEAAAAGNSAKAAANLVSEASEGIMERLAEVESDISGLASLIGDALGEPFATRAKEIISKKQGR